MPQALLIKGGRVIDPSQKLNKITDLLVLEGKIFWPDDKESLPLPPKYLVLDAAGLIVCPGFIDLHCHLREPGFEEKETIATGTKAAAKGGFTTLCCMPNTNPPLDNQAAINYVSAKAQTEGVVRVLPIGCITKGRKGEELAEMGELAAAGVVAYSDDGDPVTHSNIMRSALEYSLIFGLPVIDHCEDKSLTNGGVMNEGWLATRLGLKGIPATAEEIMVARDLALAQLTSAKLHLAHISTEGSVALIRQAKEKGIKVTAEVTPHHLTLTEERVIGKERAKPFSRIYPLPLTAYDTNAKVNPPLRTRKDVQALINGLKEGVIDAIATDHSPHTFVNKVCEFSLAAFGISGLETALGSLLELVHTGQLDLEILISKLTFEPAKILGSKYEHLGSLKVDSVADITLFDPQKEWIVTSHNFASKGKNNSWEGCRFKGKVMATLANGKIVYKDETLKVEVV